MLEVSVRDVSGQQLGTVQLPERVFGIEPQRTVIHDAVVQQLAALRRGTHAAKTRAEVRGGGKKPWRQKGKGLARHGSTRSPIWVGGGVTFGPKPRCYNYRLNRKVRRLAIRSALSARAQAQEIHVLQNLELAEAKTQAMVKLLKDVGIRPGRSLLIVTEGRPQERELLASRNLPGVRLIAAANLNTLDIARHEQIIMTKGAVQVIDEVFGT